MLLIGSAVVWRIARRAHQQHANDEGLAALKQEVAQHRGDARVDARALGRADVRRQWEQRLGDPSSSGKA